MRGRCEPTSNSDIAQWSQWWTRHSFSIAFQLAGQSSRYCPKPHWHVWFVSLLVFRVTAVLLISMQSYCYFLIQLNLNPFFPQVWTIDWKSWVENFMRTLFNLTGTQCFQLHVPRVFLLPPLICFFCHFFLRPSVCRKNDLSSFFASITSCILFSTSQMYRIK